MRGLIIEPEADDELAAALDWYETQERGLGAALLSEVDAVLNGLRAGELRGVGVPDVRDDLTARRVILDRFPYAVVFLDHAAIVHVLAFAHHKRRPGYWAHRVGP